MIREKVVSILRLTEDGDLLTPYDLTIINAAINDNLTESGKIYVNELFNAVAAGTYRSWIHGIEHLVLRHNGEVTYKGRPVEHFDISYAYTEKGREELIEVARRCQHLEKLGIEPTSRTVVWEWEKYQEEKCQR